MIAAIEFDSNGRPCRIVRMDAPAGPVLDQLLEVVDRGHRLDEEDVNYSKRDECCYRHDVGSWMGRIYLSKLCDGLRHKMWAHPEATFCGVSSDEVLTEAEIVELGYDVYSDSPNPPLSRFFMTEGSTYYCERCDDNLPDQEPCDCVYWCNTCGMLLDKKSERCEHYCGDCEVELHYGDCDACFTSPVVA